MCPAPVRTPGCAATRRSPALTGLRVDGSCVSPSPGTSSDAQDAALVRCRVTSHGLSLRLERGGGVSAGLLHFPAGNAAGWRHEAHRIIEVGPGASSGPLLLRGGLHPPPGLRGRERVVVSGKRPKEESGFRRATVHPRRAVDSEPPHLRQGTRPMLSWLWDASDPGQYHGITDDETRARKAAESCIKSGGPGGSRRGGCRDSAGSGLRACPSGRLISGDLPDRWARRARSPGCG
jgi:hypothetical protein